MLIFHTLSGIIVERLATIIAIVVAVIIYVLAVIILKIFTKEELNAKSQEELTQIKIEAATFEYTTYISNNMGLLALLISVITLINTMILGKNFIDSFNIFCLVALFICVIMVLTNLLRFKNAQKWRKYILAVIDELIEKSQDEISTYKIEIEDKSTHEKTVYIEKIKK